MKGKCGTNESELEISWLEQAYTLKLFFLKVRGWHRGPGCAAVLPAPDRRRVPPAGGAQHVPGPGGFLEARPDPVRLRHLRAHLLQGRRQP